MTTEGHTSPAAYQAEKFTDAIEKIRKQAAAGAQTLGAVGSVAVGVVGVAKFSDVFPVPDGGALAAVLVVAGVLAMGAAVVWLTLATWRVGDPVLTTNDPAKNDVTRMDEDTRAVATTVYQDLAGKPSLDDWQQLVFRLEEQALEAQAKGEAPAVRERLQNQADAKRLEIRAAQARVGMLVVRQRARNARRLRVLVPSILLFVTGLCLSALLADNLEAMRTATDTRTATVQACAEAAAALEESRIGIAELPSGCAKPEPAPATDTVEPANRGELLGGLTTAYQNCLRANPGDHQKCAWILTLIGDAAG